MPEPFRNGNCQVVFSCAAWAFRKGAYIEFFNECEEEVIVIGNIYENPNLYDTNYPNPPVQSVPN